MAKTRKSKKKLDDAFWKIHQLIKTCGICNHKFGDEESSESHVEMHKEEGKCAICQTCHLIIAKEDVKSHLADMHKGSAHRVKMEVNSLLIEFRIEDSNFYAENMEIEWSSFSKQHKRNWENLHSIRSIGVFRLADKKLKWKCVLCPETESKCFDFQESIGMRALALSHLEMSHRNEILERFHGFFDSEFEQLAVETDFDIRGLMRMARHRIALKRRSFRTFYTVNLRKMTNGERLEGEMKRRSGMEGEKRFCLVCCCLVSNDGAVIQRHFKTAGHDFLMATSPSTIFTENLESAKEDSSGQKGMELEEADKEKYGFPAELFRYSKVFKDVRRDEFCWKCTLCSLPSHLFATWHTLRMFALRHIEEKHSRLFTEHFLSFEWRALRQELRVGCDLRGFTPLQYTVKGENSFNKSDPNDYILPHQSHFLPKESRLDTVICGFCYLSLHHVAFLNHIVLHGFNGQKTCPLNPPNDKRVNALIGEYSEELLDDEPDGILSIEGKRMRDSTAMEMKSETVKSTPRSSRQSAHDARKLLSDTFRILQQSVKRPHNTSSESTTFSSSSSSDDENSEDEKLEESLMTKAELEKKTLKKRRIQMRRWNELTPSEIREWILEEAAKKGIEWVDPSSEEDSDDDVGESQKTWDDMRPEEIRKLIKDAAKQNNVKIEEGDSDDTDSDD